MKKVFNSLSLFVLALSACTASHKVEKTTPAFDWQAHRGGRGLMPENTLPAMKNAIDLGVTTLEMDAVISKDHKVVVSHDPFFNEHITTTPEGTYLTKKEAAERLLYTMPYDSIRKYDVGLKPYADFPRQQKIKAYKPLLSELVDEVEAYAKTKGRSMYYNIEVKSKEGFDGVRHPDPKTFSDLLLSVVKEKNILERTTIQSFDVRALQYIHGAYPGVVLSYLVEDRTKSLEQLLDKLGFTPQVYSPHFSMVTKEVVQQCHQKGIKVIPWTVNTLDDIQLLKAMGVDGIISDYPDLFAQVH